MTREEREAAIAYIKGYRKLDEDLHNTAPKDSISYYATDKCLKYWDMAIQALSQEPTDRIEYGTDGNAYKLWISNGKEFEQEPCEDAISREAVLETQVKYAEHMGATKYWQMRDDIRALPSVTQKSGVWVEIDDEPHEVWECDHCGFVIDGSGCIEPYEYRDTYKFCPNCGAKMVETQERSDKE